MTRKASDLLAGRSGLCSAVLLAPFLFVAAATAVPAATAAGAAATPSRNPAQSRCGLVCVLAPTGTSLSVTGTGSMIVNAPGITVDSTSSPSVRLTSSGNVIVPASVLNVTGSVSYSVRQLGSGSVGGQGTTIVPNVAPSPDPVAGLSGVAVPNLAGTARAVTVSNQTETIGPGVYSTISVIGTSQLTLAPGPYVITQLLDVSGGIVEGKGVTLYFACASYPTPCAPGQRGASLVVGGTGLLYTTPPPDNASCIGLSVVFDPHNTSGVNIPGSGNPAAPGNGSLRLDGILYDPAGSLNMTGPGTVALGQLVVGTLKLANSGFLLVPGTGIPPGPLGGLGGPDTCNLVFDTLAEPTAQQVDVPMAGGAPDDYLPGSTNPVVVHAEDGAGHVITGFNGPVTVGLLDGSGTAGATLAGTRTVDAVNGVARFPGLSVDTSGTSYVLQATASLYNSGTSTGFNIFPTVNRCEAPPGGSCSVSAAAPDSSETATMSLTDNGPDPEWVLIGLTDTAGAGYTPCPHTTTGAGDTVTTAIYDAVTHLEDSNAEATVTETVAPGFVGAPQRDPVTNQLTRVVCYAADITFGPAFAAAPDWGATTQTIGNEQFEIGVLPLCGSTPPPPPPPSGTRQPAFTFTPPCALGVPVLNPDGSLTAQWLTAGDPVGRGR